MPAFDSLTGLLPSRTTIGGPPASHKGPSCHFFSSRKGVLPSFFSLIWVFKDFASDWTAVLFEFYDKLTKTRAAGPNDCQ
jgi:hypothetical protein